MKGTGGAVIDCKLKITVYTELRETEVSIFSSSLCLLLSYYYCLVSFSINLLMSKIYPIHYFSTTCNEHSKTYDAHFSQGRIPVQYNFNERHPQTYDQIIIKNAYSYTVSFLGYLYNSTRFRDHYIIKTRICIH